MNLTTVNNVIIEVTIEASLKINDSGQLFESVWIKAVVFHYFGDDFAL